MSKRYRDLPSGHKEQLGPELIVNGDFTNWTADDPDGWGVADEDANNYVTESSGACRIVSNNTASIRIYQGILSDNKSYRVTVNVTDATTGSLTVWDVANPTLLLLDFVGEKTAILRRGVVANANLFIIKTAACDVTIDNVSVKEILVEEVDEILNISAQSGSILDRWGNTLTPTDMTVYKDGEVNAMYFDGATSKISAGTPDTLVGDKSFIIWVKGHKYSGAATYLIGNTQFALAFNTPDNLLSITSDGGGTIANDAYTLPLDIWTLIIAVRNAAGLIDFYVNGEIVYSALDTGTPAAGTDIIINSEPTSFQGTMNDIRIVDGLLTAQECSQLFSSESARYLL